MRENVPYSKGIKTLMASVDFSGHFYLGNDLGLGLNCLLFWRRVNMKELKWKEIVWLNKQVETSLGT